MRPIYGVEVSSPTGAWVTSRFFHTLRAANAWAKRYAGRIVKIEGSKRTLIEGGA